MNYYSQTNQDRRLSELLGPKTQGYFIDIGAHDGVTYSNTYGFEQLGWDGVCVEPHPASYAKCKEARKCQVVNACISNATKPVQFMQVDGAPEMLSGIAEFYPQAHKDRISHECRVDGGTTTIVTIDSYTFDDMAEKYKVPNEIDFISIDTEGSELAIVKSINFNKYKIKYFTIENNYGDTDVVDYLVANGYKYKGKAGADDILELII